MKKKILFCATVDYHIRLFHLPFIQWLKSQGWEVHVAAAGNSKLPYVDQQYHLPIHRFPLRKENILAYQLLESIIESNSYDIVDCHTPVGGMIARLAAKNRRKDGLKVMYTAHGFHFCKGAPYMNWLMYYPIEKLMANYTDLLITINQEDYQLARQKKFKAADITHIHGVGVDTDQFFLVSKEQKNNLREKHRFPEDAFLLFYAAEFNRNKNQAFLIKVLALLKETLPNAILVLAGDGKELSHCRQIAYKMDVNHMVRFLGYQNNMNVLLQMSDIVAASSKREGLPVNIMEAMSCGLPIVAFPNRGHRELVLDGVNGWLECTEKGMAERIVQLAENPPLRFNLGKNGRKIIIEKYSQNQVLAEKRRVYQSIVNEMEERMEWTAH